MLLRVTGLIVLLLAPAAGMYLSGFPDAARNVALGTALAFHLGVLARPLAPFSFLIAGLYAAAAITANFTDGVAALIVASAAATGAASSLGYHRGLLAMLAAALIGSFDPATADIVAYRSLSMFAGCMYGFLLVCTAGRTLVVHRPLAVHSKTALSYSVLLAVLVLVAWFTARMAGLEQAWWLPLTVAALGEPWLRSTPGNAVARLALALAGTLLALALFESLVEPSLRAACAVTLLLAMLTFGRKPSGPAGFPADAGARPARRGRHRLFVGRLPRRHAAGVRHRLDVHGARQMGAVDVAARHRSRRLRLSATGPDGFAALTSTTSAACAAGSPHSADARPRRSIRRARRSRAAARSGA